MRPASVREKLGFVFQDFNLLDTLSVKDNILLPLVLSQTSQGNDELRSIASAGELGIHQLLEKYPYEISGGQNNWVAVARAIITSPEKSLLLMSQQGRWIPNLQLRCSTSLRISITWAKTILMVTHSTAAAARAKRVLFIKDGILYNQIFRGEKTERQMFQEISDTLTVMAGKEGS